MVYDIYIYIYIYIFVIYGINAAYIAMHTVP